MRTLWGKQAVILSVALICSLGNIKILYAQTHLAKAHLINLHLNDPCPGAAIGQACPGGALYAGTYN